MVRVESSGKIHIFVITLVDAWGMCIAMVMPHLSDLRKEAAGRTIFIAIKLVMVVCWNLPTFTKYISHNFVPSFLY